MIRIAANLDCMKLYERNEHIEPKYCKNWGSVFTRLVSFVCLFGSLFLSPWQFVSISKIPGLLSTSGVYGWGVQKAREPLPLPCPNEVKDTKIHNKQWLNQWGCSALLLTFSEHKQIQSYITLRSVTLTFPSLLLW